MKSIEEWQCNRTKTDRNIDHSTELTDFDESVAIVRFQRIRPKFPKKKTSCCKEHKCQRIMHTIHEGVVKWRRRKEN